MGQILTLCSPTKREDTHSNTGDGSLEEPSRILTFNSKEEWRAHFNASKKMMVIDFSASWCGPCRFIEPAVIKLAAKFTDVDFLKIDVDALPEVAQEFGVEAMPTFILFKQGKEVDKVVGANSNLLEEKIKKHIPHK